MPTLPHDLFINAAWTALHTRHQHFRIEQGDACRYPADVAPFAAVATTTPDALNDLATLLTPGESVWLFADTLPPTRALKHLQSLPCVRMILPAGIAPPAPSSNILPLAAADAPDMVALTDIAFPGFFRPQTCLMGSYFGIRNQGQLIAMCGERLMLSGYPELSGLCTHPGHRGRGYAESLLWQLVRKHRADGETSWLHVSADNHRAITLYQRMGFVIDSEVILQRVALPN